MFRFVPNVFCLPGFRPGQSPVPGWYALRFMDFVGIRHDAISPFFKADASTGRQAALSDRLLSFDNPRHGNGWQVTR